MGGSVRLQTDPAGGAPPPHGRLRLRLRQAGDPDPGLVQVVPGRADVDRVGRGAGPGRPVTRQQQQVVHVDVPRLHEGVVLLGRDAR